MAVWNCLWHCMRQLSAAFTANNFSWCQFVRSHHWTKRTIVWFISFGWLCFSFSNCHIASVAAKKLFGEKFTTFHLDRVTIIMTWRGEQIHRKIQMFFHLTNIKQKQWKYQHDKSEKNERVKKKSQNKTNREKNENEHKKCAPYIHANVERHGIFFGKFVAISTGNNMFH